MPGLFGNGPKQRNPGGFPPAPHVPPSGFAGAGQQTQAAQAVTFAPASIAGFSGKSMFKRRRKKKRAASASKSRTRKRSSSRKRKLKRLVKGSRAAKAYMAKIRRMRK